MNKKTEYITISPADFISPPYIKCPKCGKDTFGVLIIASESYCRRCAVCYFPTPQKGESSVSFPLPKLSKKVIYVDQMAISNMMLFLNPNTKSHKRARKDTFWGELFERLDTLCKAQLVICPDSHFHKYESLMSPYYKSLERLYELLSHGVTFYDNRTIERFQVLRQLRSYLGETKILDLDVHKVVHGRINEWQDRLIIKANMQDSPMLIDEIRKNRESVAEAILPISKRWQSEKGKDFSYWYAEESKAAAKVLIEEFCKYHEQFALISYGKMPFQAEDLLPPPSVVTIHAIKDKLKEHGIKEQDLNVELGKFLRSKHFEATPCHKIAAMMYASMARKIAYGRKEPPNKGFMNDVQIISSLLPYCDAMFIDNECRAFLMENPPKRELAYKTKLFSYNNRNDFISYLDDIKGKAKQSHWDKVTELYGEGWLRPYVQIFRDA